MIYGAQTRDVMIVINLKCWEEKANYWSRRGIWLWDLTLPAPNFPSSTWISTFAFTMQGCSATRRSSTQAAQISSDARLKKREPWNVFENAAAGFRLEAKSGAAALPVVVWREAGRDVFTARMEMWGTGPRADRVTASTSAEIKLIWALRLADKGDTSSWRAGKTERKFWVILILVN